MTNQPNTSIRALTSGWNLNTLIALAGFVITVGTLLFTLGRFTNGMEETRARFETWRSDHEMMHRDRLAAVTSAEARTDERIKSLEALPVRIENITHRLTVQEQGAVSLSKSLSDLQKSVSDQSADLRVIREILTRMDRENKHTQSGSLSRE